MTAFFKVKKLTLEITRLTEADSFANAKFILSFGAKVSGRYSGTCCGSLILDSDDSSNILRQCQHLVLLQVPRGVAFAISAVLCYVST